MTEGRDIVFNKASHQSDFAGGENHERERERAVRKMSGMRPAGPTIRGLGISRADHLLCIMTALPFALERERIRACIFRARNRTITVISTSAGRWVGFLDSDEFGRAYLEYGLDLRRHKR